MTDLAFLIDFTLHVNKLNLQLQKKAIYQSDVRLYYCLRKQATSLGNSTDQFQFAHFPNLGLCKPANSDKYISVIVSTKSQFESRFGDMKKQKDKFDLFAMPFSVDVNFAAHELQMEIIELQSSGMLKAKFDSVPLANFYVEHVPKSTYPHPHDHAKRVMCMFGSTYYCEQLFSKMNYTKNKLRNCLSDRHLHDVRHISSTKLPVDFNALAITQKQRHPSH